MGTSNWERAAFLALAVVTTMRLAPLYTEFSATYDESFHIAAGMEWLDQGRYTYEWLHPPLARVATALLPYGSGARSQHQPNATGEGNQILLGGSGFQRNLTLARLGTLPFLLLASVVVVLWARRWCGPRTGVWTLFLLLSLPPVLGHAALATLDVACMATVLAALYQFLRWLEDDSAKRTLWLSAALSLALLTKFSSIPFLAAGGAAAMIFHRGGPKRGWKSAAMAFLVTFVFLWAGYRFSMPRLGDDAGIRAAIETRAGHSADWLLDAPLPLAQWVGGVIQTYGHNANGHAAYLLGQYNEKGWWYFFLVVLAVKTPLSFLVIAGAGCWLSLRRWASVPWQLRATLFFPPLILGFCLTSNINLGVRHILVLYPLLALMGGAFLAGRNRYPGWLAAVLVTAESWAAHPDYLASFNLLAGTHPERILVESDLDWGQDLYRLSRRLKQLNMDRVSLAYFGTVPLDHAGLPAYEPLSATRKTPGWVAISGHMLFLEFARNGDYGWLKSYEPDEVIGKSIYLYRIE